MTVYTATRTYVRRSSLRSSYSQPLSLNIPLCAIADTCEPEEGGSGHMMQYSKYSSLVVSDLMESGSGDLAAGRSIGN